MKESLHPEYKVTRYECSCGNTFESMSTKGGNLHIELCDKCHPFYTGQQKLIDTGGRVQRFADKYGAAATATLEKDAAAKEARRRAAEELEIIKRAQREEKVAAKAAKANEFAAQAKSAPAVDEVGEEAADALSEKDADTPTSEGDGMLEDSNVAGIDAAEAEQEAEIQEEDAAAAHDAATAGDLADQIDTADILSDAAGAPGDGLEP
ncbi:MAG: 50S ribosomal protein L31 [Actinomycetia bacterium]|nr:50S ribosomal protein L31 [Actinomycetes bacterium]